MLAIVIPYYKIDFFGNTLQSLLNQTDKKFNVYIGDDASPDSPKKLINIFSSKINIHYCRFKNNLGAISLPGQWIRCIEMVKDENWIMILGDDDTLNPNCVAEFHRNLEEINTNEVSVVRFASMVIDENGNSLTKTFRHPTFEKVTDFFIRKTNGGTRSSLSEYIFKKEILVRVGLRNFPLAWHTDDALLFEVSYFGNIFTINDASVNFRHSSKNITQKKDNLRLKAYASWSYYKFLLERIDNFPKMDRPVVYNHYERSFLNNKRKFKACVFTFSHYIGRGKFREIKNLIAKLQTPLKKNL